MTSDLIESYASQGIYFALKDKKIAVTAKQSALTSEIQKQIKAQKKIIFESLVNIEKTKSRIVFTGASERLFDSPLSESNRVELTTSELSDCIAEIESIQTLVELLALLHSFNETKATLVERSQFSSAYTPIAIKLIAKETRTRSEHLQTSLRFVGIALTRFR